MQTHKTMSYVYESKYQAIFYFALDFSTHHKNVLITNISCEKVFKDGKYSHLFGEDKQEVEQWFLNEIQTNKQLHQLIQKNFQNFNKKGG